MNKLLVGLLAVILAAISFAAGAWLGSDLSAAHTTEPAARATPETKSQNESAGTFGVESTRPARLWTATQVPRGPWRTYRIAEAIEGLDAAETIAALERSRRLGGRLQSELIELLVAHAARVAPAEIARYARPMVMRYLTKGIRSLGFEDRVAFSWVSAAPEDAMRVGFPGGSGDMLLAMSWARKAGYFEDGKPISIPDHINPTTRDRLLSHAGYSVQDKNPKLAIQLARQMSPQSERAAIMSQALGSLARQDPNGALVELLAEIRNAKGGELRATSLVFEALGKSDPAKALAEAEKLQPPYREAAYDATMLAWAGKDPRGALDTARANGLLLSRNLMSASSDILETGVTEISLIWVAMKNDATATLNWIKQLPPGQDRQDAIMAAGDAVDNDEAAEKLLQQFAKELPAAWQLEMAKNTANQSADIQQFTKALVNLPDADARADVIAEWADSHFMKGEDEDEEADPTALLSQFAEGPDRDAAILGISDRLRTKDALELANKIKTPNLRTKTFRRLALAWLKSDVNEAQQWLDATLELDAETKAFVKRKATEPPLPQGLP